MTLAAEVAIAAAERVERAGGPKAGLAVWRRLAESGASSSVRGRAALNAIRCAARLRDHGALRALVGAWAAIDGGLWDDVFALCKDLWREGLRDAATGLADAEAKRSGTARALYARARLLEARGDDADRAYAAAAARADNEGAVAIARAARIRRASSLARAPETLAEALEIARGVDASSATAGERLRLASVLLRAPSRFARASALGLLDDLTRAPELREAALALAARHADARGDALTPLEVDRLLALFSREPVAARAARARDAVRDLVAGRVPPPSATSATWRAIHEAAAALRDSGAAAVSPVAYLTARAASSAEPPPQAWTIAQAALGHPHADVRAAAGALVAALFREARSSPPRGWLGLAAALAAAGMSELAEVAHRSAVTANEPGADDALVVALTRSGWELASRGERSRALARLREARSLSRRSQGATPSP